MTRLAEFATSQPQASYAAFTTMEIFYENSAGCLDATAAFRMCNLGCAYTIAHRTKLSSSKARSSSSSGAYGGFWVHKSITGNRSFPFVAQKRRMLIL